MVGALETDSSPADLAGEGPGQTEVQHLDLAVGGALDVGGLQVAVDDALLVGLFQSLGDLAGDVDGLVDRQRPALQRLRQILAFDQFHDQEGAVVRGFEAEDRGDVGMVQRGQHLGFALEAGHAVAVGGEFGRQDLQGDIAVQLGVMGAVDFAHPALADYFGDPVVGQHCSGLHGGSWDVLVQIWRMEFDWDPE